MQTPPNKIATCGTKYLVNLHEQVALSKTKRHNHTRSQIRTLNMGTPSDSPALSRTTMLLLIVPVRVKEDRTQLKRKRRYTTSTFEAEALHNSPDVRED